MDNKKQEGKLVITHVFIVGNYDITESKITPNLAIIQQSILVKRRKNTTMTFYDIMSKKYWSFSGNRSGIRQ